MAEFDILSVLGLYNSGSPVVVDEDNPVPVMTTGNSIHTSTQIPSSLAIDEEFFGSEWLDTRKIGHYLFLIAGLEAFDTVELQWSDDGATPSGAVTAIENDPTVAGPVTYNVYLSIANIFTSGRYFRVHIINGGVAQSAPALIGIATCGKDPYSPLIGINDPISLLSKALLVRSTIAGNTLDGLLEEDGGFANAKIMQSGALMTAIPWETIYQYKIPDDPVIPSGAAPIIDQVLNTEANTLDTGWLPVKAFPGGQFINIIADQQLIVFLLNASDVNGSNLQGEDFPALVTTAGSPATLGAPMFDDFYRMVAYNVSGTTINKISLRSMGLQTPPPPIYTSLDQDIFSFYPAPVGRNVGAGQRPDGEFGNLQIQGASSANSTSIALDGDGVFRGQWVRWSNTHVTLLLSMTADVLGTLYIDFSEEESPVNGDESSVSDSIAHDYIPANTPRFRRTFPVQSKWVRVRYVNGPTAQTILNLGTTFLTVSATAPTQQANIAISRDNLVSLNQSITSSQTEESEEFGEVYVQDKASLNEDTGKRGKNTHITGIDVEYPIKPLNTARVGQGTVISSGAAAFPGAGLGLTGRKTVEYSNHSANTNIFFGFTQQVTTLTGKILRSGSDIALELDDSVDVWFIADDTGGATSQSNQSGSTAGGTATNPSNALASDGSYASVAAGQTITVGDFTYSITLDEVTSLRVGIKGKKDPGAATETVAYMETKEGSATSASNSITTSAALAGGTNQLYVVSVTRNALNNISGFLVNGAPVTFTPIESNLAGGGRHLDMWYYQGTIAAGTVTAQMSTAATGHISVQRLTLFDSVEIQTPRTATGMGSTVTGATLSKVAGGFGITAVSHEASSATAGSGYTKRTDLTTGTGSNTVGLAVETKSFVADGTEAATMGLSETTDWLAMSVRILPAAALNISYLIEIDVNGGGYTSVGTVTFTTTSDDTKFIDISGVHPSTEGDINLTTIRATRTTAGAAAGLIDWAYLEVGEGEEGTSVRLSYLEIGDNDFS